MNDHYETRCQSCGGSDEQGCYADCPATEVPRLKARIEQLEAALRDALSYSTIGDMPVTIYENARAALDSK